MYSVCVRACVHTSVAVAWGNVAIVLCFLKHFLMPWCFHNHLILSVNRLLSLTDALGAPKNQPFFFFFFLWKTWFQLHKMWDSAGTGLWYKPLCAFSLAVYIVFFSFFSQKTYFIHRGCFYIYIYIFFFFCISLKRFFNREKCHYGWCLLGALQRVNK